MSPLPTIEEYNASLDPALIAYVEHNDRTLIDAHYVRFPELHRPDNPHVECSALMKAATGRRSLPMHVRSKAKKWLLDQGYSSYDDGDVPIEAKDTPA